MLPPNLRISENIRTCGECRHYYAVRQGHVSDGECLLHTERSYRPEHVRGDFVCDDWQDVAPDLRPTVARGRSSS